MKERNLYYLLVPLFLLQALTVITVTGRIFRMVVISAQTGLWLLDFLALADVLVVLAAARKLSRTMRAQEPPEENGRDRLSQESLLLTAKAQRHDFLNHLTVISGLLNLNLIEETKAYLDQFCTDVRDVSSLLSLGKPVIGSLILNKVNLARAQGIDFTLTVQTDLSALWVKETYITKILGNIIDNGIEATLAASERKMELKVYEDAKNYMFEVTDSGTTLNEAIVHRIFEPMFSTKGPDRGIGLAIARHLTDICGGRIEVKLFPTTFTVTFGKRQQNY